MALFFKKRSSFHASWNFSSDAEDEVLIGKGLWQSLCSTSPPNNLCLSIAPRDSSIVTHTERLICYGRLEEGLKGCTLAIPKKWVKEYSLIFNPSLRCRTVLVTLTNPIILSTIVLVAGSTEAYLAAAARRPSLLNQLMDGRILRYGDRARLQIGNTEASLGLVYQLQQLEPVPQGLAQPGQTKIILLSSGMISGIDLSDKHDNVENDAFEIDESFLASSVFNTHFDHPEDQDFPTVSQDLTLGLSNPSLLRFDVDYLDFPNESPEENWILYVRTTDLGRIGILSRNWVIACFKLSQSRLVRVVADDMVALSATVKGSPILVHNILGENPGIYDQKQSFLYLLPSPFGSYEPPIPLAQSVSIACVASPLSMNRRFQSLIFNALKTYFNSGRKLVKQSDVLAVPIDTDDPSLMSEPDHGDKKSDETFVTLSHVARHRRYNEVLFFKVTNVNYASKPQSNSSSHDFYEDSTFGELGCWVDPTTTRIVQTGVEHSRVPDVMSYMQLDHPCNLAKHRRLNSLHLLGPQSPFTTLLALTTAALSQHAVDFNLNLSFLLEGGRGSGKFTITSWAAQNLGLHLIEIDCYDFLDENLVKTEATLRVRFEQALSCTPCLIVLRHLEALSRTTLYQNTREEFSVVGTITDELAKLHSAWRVTGYPLIVVGTTSDSDHVDKSVLNGFKHVIKVEAPNEYQRLEILRCLLAEHNIATDVSLQHIATRTAALLAGDLRDLVTRAKAASIKRVGDLDQDSFSIATLSAADFETALAEARDSHSETIGAPKIPNVSWEDIGGLAHVQSDIVDTIQLPLEHPEFFAEGLKKRSGILLYGPPGTGKTLIAKAVATSCSLNFFSVKGPELLNMYIGESEANVRRVFQRARDAKPCVIFFDELDSVAPKRGNHGDSGGVMDRIVSQLLAELDGISSGKGSTDVFVIGATNRPDLLDPALLRPGRFDRMLYLGVSETHEAQLKILEALTRKFPLDPGLDLRTVAEKCPFHYTGADFYALCSDAMLSAMSRKAEDVNRKTSNVNALPPQYQHPHPMTPQYYLAELASPEDIEVLVSADDFERSLQSLIPSVSQAEMEHYAEVQRRFTQESMPIQMQADD